MKVFKIYLPYYFTLEEKVNFYIIMFLAEIFVSIV